MTPIEIDNAELLASLYRMGHFWNPSKPDLLNVRQEDVSKLTVDHKLAKEAIASWQSFDANFDVLGLIIHLRRIIADGDIGPVTHAMLVNVPRCPIPDFPPPPNAAFDYGNPDLNAAVKSYQKFAEYKGGSGSWPKCDPQRPDVHSTRVNMDTTKASSKQKEMLRESTAMVESCEAEVGQSVRHIFDGDPQQAEHDVRFEYIAGGVIGYAYFPEPDTCDQVVKCRIDNSFNPNAKTFAGLLLHEYKGHSDGLDHTNGGHMNSSIVYDLAMTWKGDPSESRKKKYFGGVAIPPLNPVPTPDPDPVPQPPSDHNGVFVFQGKLLKIRVWE